MDISEKLYLRWNDFQENIKSAFGLIRSGEEFTDVTLASDDGTLIQSHKIVLASSSPFFMEILKKNKHPHPLIFMRGTKTEELVAVLDFLYCGEVFVDQQNLQTFLALGEDLGLKGLAKNNESIEEADTPQHEIKLKRQHTELDSNVTNPKEIAQPMAEEETTDAIGISSRNVEVNVELEKLDEQVKSMMEVSENMLSRRNHSERAWLCKICGKEGKKMKIASHIEANHVRTDALLPCDLCGNSSRSRHRLRLHKRQ